MIVEARRAFEAASGSIASARARFVSGPIITSSRSAVSRAARTMRSAAGSAERARVGTVEGIRPSRSLATRKCRGRKQRG